MINKFGNDFKNNIMWNKEYPFIPEITNDNGFTIHEDDIVEFLLSKNNDTIYAGRVCKIYSLDYVWIVFYQTKKNQEFNYIVSANELMPYTCGKRVPKPVGDDWSDQGFFNILDDILADIYSRIYPTELNAEGDWHFDNEKFEARRQEEVDAIKRKRN